MITTLGHFARWQKCNKVYATSLREAVLSAELRPFTSTFIYKNGLSEIDAWNPRTSAPLKNAAAQPASIFLIQGLVNTGVRCELGVKQAQTLDLGERASLKFVATTRCASRFGARNAP